MKLTHASVFSGIGGPEVAATMLGWDNLFHCEINPFGRAVLDYWYPNAKSYEDITTTDFSEWRGRVTVLTGGFPCQPFSYAGQRRGAQDDRYLWPYMFRCIDQVQPDWVVAENVAGITTMVEQGKVSPMAHQASLFDEDNGVQRYQLRETFTLERICQDLEGHGYEVQPVLIPACAVGAPHRRDRVFIVARRVVADTERLATDPCSDGRPQEDIRRESRGRTSDEKDVEQPQSVFDSGSIRRNTSHTSNTRLQEEGSKLEATGSWRYALRNVAHTTVFGTRKCEQSEREECGRTQIPELGECPGERISEDESFCCSRWANFPTVSPVHSGNDGIPIRMDGASLSFGKWRTEALKAYGNAIVPQVMYEIFRAIEMTYQ